MRRRLALLVAVFGLGLGIAGGAVADNAATAVNTHDGASVFRYAFAVRQVTGDVVDETNSAVAYASCADCNTTAIAVEVVFVVGSPSTFTPVNQALAINEACERCQTYAGAWQFVVQGDGPMHFDAAGRQELEQISADIRALDGQNLTPFQLQASLEPLMAELQTVLADDVVVEPPAGVTAPGLGAPTGPPDVHAAAVTETGPDGTASS